MPHWREPRISDPEEPTLLSVVAGFLVIMGLLVGTAILITYAQH